ncbi:MAG: hypothetical protein WC141_05240 [Arcobacteraceae bacterium]
MKKRVSRRNHSQIINNFYTLVTIVMMAAVIALYTKFINPNKENKNPIEAVVLACQKGLKIEQKLVNEKLLKEAWQLFSEGNYELDAGVIVEENFTLPSFLSLKKVNEMFENSIDVVAIKNAQKFLKIKYEIIQNNKNENESQNENKKVFELDFLVSFRINAKEIIRMKTSFNTTNPNDLASKVECIMESFKANAKQ